MSDTLPPLVQEYRAKADQLLDEQKKIRDSTKQTAEETEQGSEKSKRGWLEVAKGTLAAEVAMKALGAASRALTSVISTGITEAKDAAAVNAQLAAGIQSTGNAANVTVAGMNALASEIQAYSGQTDDSIGKTQSLLLTFTNIRNVGPDRIFDDATRAAADMAARLGGDAASQAMVLGKALQDPIDGVSKLNRVGVQFTDAQKEQIRVLQESGDMAGAQGVILAELQRQFGGSAEAAGRTFPGAIERAKRAFEDLSQGVVESFLPIVTPGINAMVDALQRAAPVAQAVSDRIAGALQSIGPAIETIRSILSGGIGADRLEQMNPALLMIANLFRTVGEAARPIIEQIKAGFDQLAPVFAPLIGQVAQLWMQFSPLGMILQAVAPVLPTLIGAFVQLATTLGGVLGTTLTTLMPILSKIAGMLAGELAKVVTTLAPIIVQLATSIGGFLGQALQMVAPLIVKLAGFVAELLPALMPLVDVVLQLVAAFLPLLSPLLELVTAILGPLIDLFSGVLSAIMPIVVGLIQMLVPAIVQVASIVTGILMPVLQGIIQVLTGVINFITGVFSGNWEKAWNGIVQVFSGIFTSIKGIVAGVINAVIGIVNGVISGINGIASAVKDATGGAINIRIGSIPRVSFDIGTERVPGAKGAPLPAVVHGGEAILSNDMIEGRAPIPQRITEAVDRNRSDTPTPRELLAVGTSSKSVIVYSQTNASPNRIARDVGWVLDREG